MIIAESSKDVNAECLKNKLEILSYFLQNAIKIIRVTFILETYVLKNRLKLRVVGYQNNLKIISKKYFGFIRGN